jgi:predicted secreted protein
VPLVSYFKIICKYTGDENWKNSIKEIIDNKYILSRQKQKIHHGDLKNKGSSNIKSILRQNFDVRRSARDVRKRSLSVVTECLGSWR